MKKIEYSQHTVPASYIKKWQQTVDLMAAIFKVPAGLIMRALPEEIEVFVSNQSDKNPYKTQERASLNTGLYCETVMASKAQLHVPNALTDDNWKENPDIALNMISYLGVPLIWPDGNIFGTICVLDEKKRYYSKLYHDLLWQFKDMIEGDFKLIMQENRLKKYQEELELRVKERTVSLQKQIQKRQKRETELKQYEKVVSSTNDLLSLVNADYIFLLVNNAYAKALNKSIDEIENRHMMDIFGKELFENAIKPHFDKCLAGEYIQYQRSHDLNDIGRRYFNISYSPYIEANNKISGVVICSQDITEMKMLNERLVQSQKMELIGQLAGGVAHDFNNALTVIMGSAELTRQELGKNNPLSEKLTQILDAAQYSSNITKQLLTFARKQKNSPQVISINNAINGTLSMISKLIGENIALSWHPKKDVWPVNIDPIQIEQILTNLCINSRDSILYTGNIIIEASNIHFDKTYSQQNYNLPEGDYVLMTVKDDGIGIPEEDQQRIFDPFFTTKTIGKGTGLGLSTVYGIVKQNNGFINVESKPGQGTIFSIYLKRHYQQTALKEALVQKSDNPRGKADEVILLVEDKKLILELGQQILKELGYTVLAANSPIIGLKIAQEYSGNIHLLISDVVMPLMNGKELSEQLLKLHSNIKVIFMSGYTANIIKNQGGLNSHENFIQKPFYPKDLTQIVRRVLDQGS